MFSLSLKLSSKNLVLANKQISPKRLGLWVIQGILFRLSTMKENLKQNAHCYEIIIVNLWVFQLWQWWWLSSCMLWNKMAGLAGRLALPSLVLCLHLWEPSSVSYSYVRQA